MRTVYLGLRSVLDRLAALVLLILVSPILLACAVAVLVTMGRPLLFLQPRVGQHGVIFKIVKFRTMVPDAEQLGGGYMPDGMDLVPPLGKFLRRFSLDELPQLLNILTGDMSFIGPRPAPVDHLDRYTDRQRGRLRVKPGLTGLAQVELRNEAPWSRRIELDLEYVERVGPVLDVTLLLRTVPKVLAGSSIRYGQTAAEVDDLRPRHRGASE
jgi:lipopolysaccharide/colanic/teichoic acid biosynthesis glycosyltransferase